MADNNIQEPRRRTRKEALLTRKQQQQFRQIRLLLMGLIGFIVLVLAAGAIFEFVVKPSQPVANVNDTAISLRSFQERVRIERAQTIETVDSLYEAVGGDVNQLTQFAGQQLNSLIQPAALGNQVLFQMIDEELIRQEAAARGITVSESEVQASLEERFNFYGGELPPATEEPDEPEPTPTITPIAQETDEEAVEPEPTEEIPPAPTATAVSQEAFDEQYQEQIDNFVAAGGDEAGFRERVELDLLATKLQDALAEEQGIDTEELQFSLFYIAFSDEAEANASLAEIQGGKDYLTAWNEIRSSERVSATQPFASELDWTAPTTVSSSLGTAAAEVVETIDVGAVSDVVAGNNDRFYIIQLRGREERELSEARIEAQKGQLLREWLEEKQLDVVVFTERWSSNVPDRPVLDPKYYTPSEQPAVPEVPDIQVEPSG